MIYRSGVYNLCEAIVKQAMDDAESLVKFELQHKIGKDLPGAIRSCPQINMREIREFMTDGLFTKIYDADGEWILDNHIKNVRESIMGGKKQKLHRSVR